MNEIRLDIDGDAITWTREGEELDPAEGMAILFGRFELVARVRGLHCPGTEVLTYRAPTRRAARRLEALPAKMWLRVDDTLWMSHDGQHLLLSPTTTLHTENLLRAT